jgi:hypothetical protein
MPLSNYLLAIMSITLAPVNLNGIDCTKGQVTQQPPIFNAQFKYKANITKPEKIKLKLTDWNMFTCALLHDTSNAKTYLKFLQVYSHIREEKKLELEA